MGHVVPLLASEALEQDWSPQLAWPSLLALGPLFPSIPQLPIHCYGHQYPLPCVLKEHCGAELIDQGTTPSILKVLSAVAVSSFMSASMSTLLGTAGDTGVATASSYLGQGSHQLGNLVFQLSPFLHWFSDLSGLGPHPVPSFLILTFSLVSSHHQLWVWYTRGTEQIPDGVMDMLPYSMEKVNPEVLLGIQFYHPPWALELDLVEGPFQPYEKWGNFPIAPMAHFVDILH